jgi:hypothetical protein
MLELTSLEKETSILFNESEKEAMIGTYNPALIRQLEKLAEERPDECRKYPDGQFDCWAYRVPKKWIKIRPTRVLSEKNRARMSEQGKRMASMRKNAK